MSYPACRFAIVLLCACGSSATLEQRGVGPRPRLAAWDGHPLEKPRNIAVYGEAGVSNRLRNTAGVQAGVETRFKRGASWDASIQIDAAMHPFAAARQSVQPPFGPAIGIGGALRKSVGTGSFRLGLLASAQLWRVPIASQVVGSLESEDAAPIRPTGALGLVLGSRVTATTSIYFALAALAAIEVPVEREPDEAPRADVVPGGTAQLGARFPVGDLVWVTIYGAGAYAGEDSIWLGGGTGIELGFD